MSSPLSVVVIGGGILGVSTAVHLLRGGARVTLLTEADVASGATGRSLSWLNSAGERSTPYHDLRMAGIQRYRALAAERPGTDWLRFDGGLHWAASDEAEATRTRHDFEVGHDYDSDLVDAGDPVVIEHGIDPAAIPGQAILNRAEGWVSLPELVAVLMAEFHDRGGVLTTGAGTVSVQVRGGRAVGARTAQGRVVAADAVVVACGAATPDVVAELGVHIPNASPVSMLVLTEPVEGVTDLVLNTPRVALRPNPGGTLALDHDWYEEQVTRTQDGGWAVPPEVVDLLTDEASAVLAGHPAVRAASFRAGLKPIPGDGEPVIGELRAVPGCFVAFTHSGATLGLVVGELLAGEILSGEGDPALTTFRPERFTSA